MKMWQIEYYSNGQTLKTFNVEAKSKAEALSKFHKMRTDDCFGICGCYEIYISIRETVYSK